LQKTAIQVFLNGGFMLLFLRQPAPKYMLSLLFEPSKSNQKNASPGLLKSSFEREVLQPAPPKQIKLLIRPKHFLKTEQRAKKQIRGKQHSRISKL